MPSFTRREKEEKAIADRAYQHGRESMMVTSPSSRFRFFMIVSVIVGALVVGYGFTQIANQKHRESHRATQIEQLARGVAKVTVSTTSNRIAVITILCDSLNESRAEGLRLHKGDKGAQKDRLTLLNCTSLENSARKAAELPLPVLSAVRTAK